MADDRAAFIREAYLLVLARTPADSELRDQLREYESGQERAVVLRFLSSPEFRLLRGEWQSGTGINRDPAEHERGLQSLGSDERFVRLAYQWLFDRDADAGGLASYTRELASGLTRVDLVRTFVLADEFERRYLDIAPDAGFVPRDIQLCELANPAKWDNPDWMALLRSLGSLPDHKMAMHRKSYEFTQLLFGLDRLGYLRDDVSIVSVGAGHECVLYWLANRVARVVATDAYDGAWQTSMAREGDSRVLASPAEYAPFPYRQDRLAFMRMDGRELDFPDASFDVAYSLSSIEHFGGFEGAARAVDEMARVLKPGGVAAIATEYILSGPAYHEGFFPDQIRELFGRPGLELVQPIDERVYERYAFTPVDLQRNRHQTPHMVITDGGSVLTSVMVFLRKL
jgi:SAM-dependent methyltransferase